MKVNPFKKFNFLYSGVVFLFLLFVSFPAAFAVDESAATLPSQLADIQKKLDASEKRDEKILATQEKILEEIIISRKWARRG